MERQRGTVLPVNVSAVKQQKAGLRQRGLNLDAPPGSALLLSVFPFISLRVFGKESGKKNLRPTLLSACEALCHFPYEVPLLLLRCLHSKAGMFWQRCRQLIGSHPGPLEDLTAGGFDSWCAWWLASVANMIAEWLQPVTSLITAPDVNTHTNVIRLSWNSCIKRF